LDTPGNFLDQSTAVHSGTPPTRALSKTEVRKTAKERRYLTFSS